MNIKEIQNRYKALSSEGKSENEIMSILTEEVMKTGGTGEIEAELSKQIKDAKNHSSQLVRYFMSLLFPYD